MNKVLGIAKKNVYVALVVITLLAAFIRFYNISKVPVSLYWDEVSTGYNAYSIERTQRDEYGSFIPLLFRSYNDYKMPVNVYLTSFSIKLFGLNEFSVRFPSAFLGTLTVFVTFFLTRLLLSLNRVKHHLSYEDMIPLFASFLLAISPWHIQFSRAGFEANISLFFAITGLYLFLKGIDSYRYYIFSFIPLALSLYSYRSAFIFLPLLLAGMFVIWRKEILRKGILKLALGLFLFALVMFPIVNPLMHEGSSRFQQTSISNRVEEQALDSFQKGKPVNKKILYVQNFLHGYFSEFSPQFLFFSGDPQGRHSPRGMGLLYAWEIPFLILGIWFLLKKMPFNIGMTVLLWILIFPLPAALSIPTPHALRALNALPIPQILTTLGIIFAIERVPKNFKKPFVSILGIIIVVFFVVFVKQYTLTNTKLVISDWGDGYKQLVTYVEGKKNQYDLIVISGHYWQPYMYVLFYDKFDPATFQRTGNAQHFDKYMFGGTSWDLAVGRPELDTVNLRVLTGNKKALIALSPEEYRRQEPNLRFLTNVSDTNGKTVFIVSELK